MFQAVSAQWGNETAVLMGDWLYMSAFETALQQRNLAVLDALTEATRRMTEGELIQLGLVGNMRITEDQHLEIISRKTGHLFSASCRVGGILRGANEEERRSLANYGLYLGIAFQLVDDLLDFTSDSTKLGQTRAERFARRQSHAPADPPVERASTVRLPGARRDGRTGRGDQAGQTGPGVARRIWGTGSRSGRRIRLRRSRAGSVDDISRQSVSPRLERYRAVHCRTRQIDLRISAASGSERGFGLSHTRYRSRYRSAIRNPMIDDTALASLQRSLGEYREAKRKTKTRLAEIEAEAEMLRSQLATIEAIIEQTELALRKALFPTEYQALYQSYDQSNNQSGNQSSAYNFASYRPSEAEIEAEVAKHQQNEQASNIRFADFRIPQAATIILREANSALHVSEIYRRMTKGGFEFRGQHQLITLAVSLSRSKRFRKVAPGTFELDPEYQAGQVA